MFEERIEAWVNGPVVSALWADEHHERTAPGPRPLAGTHLDIVEYVANRYGRLTGRALIHQTHLEAPWQELADSEDDSWNTGNPEITINALEKFFMQDEEYVDARARHSKVPDGYATLTPVQPDEDFLARVAALPPGQRIVELATN
jgi:hypothetical protein